MPEHILSKKQNAGVLVILLVLTLVTWRISFADLGPWSVFTAILIAAVKATLVVLFFMHVLYSSHLTRLIIVAGLFFFGILLALTLTDYLSRGAIAGEPWLGPR
jgi:cytochrome c oxidase subunit 4